MTQDEYFEAEELASQPLNDLLCAKNVSYKIMWECGECGHTNLSDDSLLNGKDNILCEHCNTDNHVSI